MINIWWFYLNNIDNRYDSNNSKPTNLLGSIYAKNKINITIPEFYFFLFYSIILSYYFLNYYSFFFFNLHKPKSEIVIVTFFNAIGLQCNSTGFLHSRLFLFLHINPFLFEVNICFHIITFCKLYLLLNFTSLYQDHRHKKISLSQLIYFSKRFLIMLLIFVSIWIIWLRIQLFNFISQFIFVFLVFFFIKNVTELFWSLKKVSLHAIDFNLQDASIPIKLHLK